MHIQGIDASGYNPVQSTQSKTAETSTKGSTAQQVKAEESNVSKTPKTDEIIISKPKTEKTDNSDLIQKLKDDNSRRVDDFKSLIRSMIVKQGETSNLSLFGVQLNVTPEQSAKAQAAISEGGEYSVDSVASRLLDFAKAYAGDDKTKLNTMRDAFQKGFDEAGAAWGGKLPDISNKTYDEVMKRFDAWEKGDATEEAATTIQAGA